MTTPAAPDRPTNRPPAGDRHVVVVEDHHQPIARCFGIVHRLIGHARRHRAIADHRDRLARLVCQPPRHRKTQRRRDRGGRMRRAERIIFAFAAPGEPAQPAALPQRAHLPAPPGQNLVRIGLMPDIPDQPIMRRIEHMVQRHGQFDYPQPGAEMAAGLPHRADHFGAHFVGQLAQFSKVMPRVSAGLATRSSSGDLASRDSSVVEAGSRAVSDVFFITDALYASAGRRKPDQAQAAQCPRNSITGRTSAKPALRAACTRVSVRRSSSICTTRPQPSQIRKMQSCRQPGWLLAI